MISYFGLKMLNYTIFLTKNLFHVPFPCTVPCTEKFIEVLIKSLTSESEKAV